MTGAERKREEGRGERRIVDVNHTVLSILLYSQLARMVAVRVFSNPPTWFTTAVWSHVGIEIRVGHLPTETTRLRLSSIRVVAMRAAPFHLRLKVIRSKSEKFI